jgi:hypothetical protein
MEKLCGEHAVTVGLILVGRFRVFGALTFNWLVPSPFGGMPEPEISSGLEPHLASHRITTK